MKFLLDTNIISNVIRDSHGHAATRFRQRGVDQCCTSIVVAAELRFGAIRKASPILTRRVEAILTHLAVIPLESPVDHHYAILRKELERAGKPIGANDMFIAAHALALGCTLITDNVREFSRVKSLTVENWLR
ncbi:MAG TPA: type II toxin-antitoxin system VapC family toxin [Rhizomicrobium sp.]|jgi:tRNA(fMet)-specific endonuclease VapC